MSGKSSQQKRRTNLAVMLYMQELGARVVAESGIPNDRFHLGKLTLQAMKDDSDHVLQIDAGIDASETSGSILKRSVRCAIALQNLGLRRGDVMILMAPNHLDLCIPFYAALYLGILICAIDTGSSIYELNSAFKNIQPSIVFCQNDRSEDVETALKQSQTNAYVITFDKGLQFRCFSSLLEDISSVQIKYFRATDFDSEQAIAFLTMTSGTTGMPKAAALTHKNLALGLPLLSSRYFNFPKPTRVDLCVSPLQWITAGIKFVMSPILRYTRLQTSAAISNEHLCDIINKHKPTSTLMSPHLIIPLVRVGEGGRCDFSSFEVITLTGSLITQAVVDAVKQAAPNADVQLVYGMSETSTLALEWDDDVATGSVGRSIGYLQYRIVDVTSLEDISKPYLTGELWMKGPTVFKGYYKNAKATKDAFSEDGWFKSGDLFYKDEHSNFFFVDRLKALLKFRSHQISPAELEHVIRRHPEVEDVVVVGVPDEKDGDLPTAIVVPRQSAIITAEEIKDLVKESLSDSKHLRGGVVFMKKLPLMGTTKVNIAKLKKLVTEMERQ